MSSSRSTNRGFTLIEALIAIVIFGVGLLAIASLQGVARKASYEAVQRTTATQLAESLLERMRANPNGLVTYIGGLAERTISLDTAPAPVTGCDVGWPDTGCDPTTLAQVDLAQWWNLVVGSAESIDGQPVGGLVRPFVCIRGESDGATGAYSVAIAWRGTTEVDQTGSDACGAADPAYGEFRRVVVVGTYLNTL